MYSYEQFIAISDNSIDKFFDENISINNIYLKIWNNIKTTAYKELSVNYFNPIKILDDNMLNNPIKSPVMLNIQLDSVANFLNISNFISYKSDSNTYCNTTMNGLLNVVYIDFKTGPNALCNGIFNLVIKNNYKSDNNALGLDFADSIIKNTEKNSNKKGNKFNNISGDNSSFKNSSINFELDQKDMVLYFNNLDSDKEIIITTYVPLFLVVKNSNIKIQIIYINLVPNCFNNRLLKQECPIVSCPNPKQECPIVSCPNYNCINNNKMYWFIIGFLILLVLIFGFLYLKKNQEEIS
jgi:hypothetical protein